MSVDEQVMRATIAHLEAENERLRKELEADKDEAFREWELFLRGHANKARKGGAESAAAIFERAADEIAAFLKGQSDA
ncbi:MAG: hypothetical protein ACLPWS_04080 [Rhodomicrobium sp.]